MANFDGEGKLDLVVPNVGNNKVPVLLGSGDGTFGAAVNYAVGAQPYTVACDDD